MRNTKKILGIVLALIVLTLAMSISIFAQDSESVVLPDGVTVADFGDNTVTDGTNFYATIKSALEGIHLTDNRILYCKPGADVGVMTHGHVCANLTVYGNGAALTASGEQDFELDTYKFCHNGANACDGVTGELTLTVKNLNGCGAWGQRTTSNTVNIVFENCKDMNRVYVNGTSGINNITLTNCSFLGTVENRCTLYSNANGTVTVSGCEFENIYAPINLNHKVAGTQTIVIENTSFDTCGTAEYDYAAPVRVLSSVEGAESALTVSGCSFANTVANKNGQNADILLDYGVGTTNASVSSTAAKVTVEVENNVSTDTTVSVGESKGFANVEQTGLKGTGTEADPFLIEDLDDLIWFRDQVDLQLADGSTQFAGKYFKLTTDIDLAGINWNPIGTMSGDHGSFKGVFDGGNNTISNLNVQQAGNGIGLFARTTGKAVIKNLKLDNVTVKSTDNSNYVGGLVGNAYASTYIENVHVTGTIDISGRGYIGGIAGHGYVVMDNVSVDGTGTIYSTFWCAGGILGYAGEGSTNIMNAHVEGITITSAAGGLGAIVGMAEDNNGTQPISGSNLSAKDVEIKTYTGAYGDSYANYALGYLYGGNPTSELTGTLTVENVVVETSTGEAVQVNDAVASVNGKIYFSLADAIANAVDGATVTLLKDVVLTSGITVSGKSITLDGNGYSISGKADANYGYQAIYFYNAGETTIKNVTFKNFVQSNVSAIVLRLECSDKFILEDVYFDNCDVAKGTTTEFSVMRVYDTDFTATNLNFTNCKGAMLMDIGPSSNDFAGLIEIKDSKFENNTVIGTALIYTTLNQVENSYLSIDNTSFKGNVIGDATSSSAAGRGVIHLGSDSVITNCTFDGNNVYGSHANNVCYGINEYSGYNHVFTGNTFKNSAAYQTNSKVGPVSGTAIMTVGTAVLENNVVENNNKFYNRASGDVEYTEQEVGSVGTYTDSYGKTTIISGTYNGKLVSYNANEGFAVKGGTYSTEVADAYCADGFVCEANGDGTYGIKSTYIEVSTWEELVNAIADKNITDIKLIADITANGRLVVDRDLHIDLGENTLYLTQTNNRVWKASTLTIDGNGVINVSAVNGGNVFYVGSAETGAGTSGNLVLNDIEVFGENYNTGTNAAVFMLYGPAPSTLTITNCELNLKNNQGNGSVFYDTGTNNQCKINIVDSELNFDGTVRGSVCGDITIDNSTVVIKNCDNGFNEATLTIKNGSNVTITDNTGRGITVNRNGYGIVIEDSTVTLGNNGEGDIRYKASANITITNSDLNLCNVVVDDGTVATINGLAVENGATVESVDGVVTINNPVYVAEVNGVGYETLAEAFANANGGTVVLLDDITIDTETITIADGVSVTLDMNGKTITVVDNKASNVCYELFYIYGELTVTGNGTIKLTSNSNDTAWAKSSSIFHNRGGVLTIENGTFEHLGGTCMAFVVDNSGNYYGDATTNIKDGELTSSYIAIRNRMEQNSHGASGKAILNVEGGKISGTSRAIWAQAASTSLTAPATGAINISGGEIGLIDTARSEGAVSMTIISGGAVSAFKGEVGELTVTGGTLDNVTILTASGEAADYVINANGTYVLAVAKIGEVKYETLADALAAAQNGDIITIVDDFTLQNETATTPLAITKDVTIDLNGKTITATGHMFRIEANVTFKNGTLNAEGMGYCFFVGRTIENDGFVAGNLTIESGTYIAQTSVISVTAGLATIEGGEFTVVSQYGTTYMLNCVDRRYPNNANVVVKGGIFKDFDPSNCAAEGTGTNFVADGYVAIKNLDGNCVVGEKPTATVNPMGPTIIPGGEYGVWDGSSYTGTTTEDMPLSFVMQFLADQNASDMANSPYADWYADFVITFTGLEEGSFIADGCYLAGYYGDFGWVKIPVDGMTIEDGARYPVMLGVGLGQKYDYICTGVQDFKCALYIAPEILEANPNLNVNLELAVVDNSKGGDAAAEALVENELVYSVNDHDYVAEDFVVDYVAKVGDKSFTSFADAVAYANENGGTVTLLDNIELSESVKITGTVTLDLAGKTITGTDDTTSSFALIYNVGTLTIKDSVGNGKITLTATNDTGYNRYSSVISNNPGGTLVVESGTIEHLGGHSMAYAIDNLTNGATTSAVVTINGGTINSAYIAIRQFLNGVGATNTLTINGGTINGTNSSIYFQSPSAKANTGTLVVSENAVLTNRVYFGITSGTTEWPVEVSIAASALQGERKIAHDTLPNGYVIEESNGVIGVSEVTYVAQIGDVKYETLQDALDAGGEVKLLTNVELDAPIVVTGTVVIDLAGYTINYTSTVQGEAMFTNYGTLTINDTVGGGEIYYNYVGAADSSYGKGNYTINNAGTLTVNGGKISIANISAHAKYPINNSSLNSDAILEINGGWLYNYNTSAIRMICGTYRNSVTINGGLVEGYSAIWVQNPGKNTTNCELTITGGEIKSTAKAYVNGTAELKDVSSKIYFTIDGEGGAWSNASFVNITGGIFNENVKLVGDVPANCTVDQENATFNGYLELPKAYVAQVGDTKYESLAEAISNANGGTVTLLDNVELTETIKVTTGTVTLDLNGYVISGTCNASQASLIYIENGAKLTVEDTSTEETGKITYAQGSSNVGWTIDVKGELVLESGTIELTGSWNIGYAVDVRPNSWGTEYTQGSSFVMNGGKIISSDGGVRVASSSASNHKNVSASFTMNGGLIDAAWDGVFVQQSDAIYDKLNLTINGGTIESDLNPIRVYGPAPTGYVDGTNCMNVTLAGGTLTYTGTEAREWLIEGILRVGGGSSVATIVENGTLVVTSEIAQSNVAPDGYEWTANENGTYSLKKIEAYIEWYGNSITLGDNLEMAFYAYFDSFKEGEQYYAKVIKHHIGTCGNDDIVIYIPIDFEADYREVGGEKLIKIIVSGIAAKEMTCEISCEIFVGEAPVMDETTNEYGENTGYSVSTSFVDSVVEYAMWYLDNSSNVKLQTLLVDMLNYGAAAQIHFDHYVQGLANSQLTDAQKALATPTSDNVDDYQYISDYTDITYFAGTTLSLEASVHMNFYLKNVSSTQSIVVSFTHHTGRVHHEIYTPDMLASMLSNGSVKITVDDLAPADAEIAVSCSIYEGAITEETLADSEPIFTAVESIESYCSYLIFDYTGEKQDTAKEMGKKIVAYSKSAYAYFH